MGRVILKKKKKKIHRSEFPELSFCLIYGRLGAPVTGNPEMPRDAGKKKKAPIKACSLAKTPRKGQPPTINNLHKTVALLQPNITENTVALPPPCHKDLISLLRRLQ